MASECYREDGAKVEVEWIIRNAIRSSWARGVSRSKMRTARHSQIQRLESILNLPKCDRLVFSICLLWLYSIHNRAVLLAWVNATAAAWPESRLSVLLTQANKETTVP